MNNLKQLGFFKYGLICKDINLFKFTDWWINLIEL